MGIRRILSSARDPPIDEVIKAGLLEALAKALEIDVSLSIFFCCKNCKFVKI